MQFPPTLNATSAGAVSPAESIHRHMRWLLAIALAGIGVLLLSLGFATYTVPTVLVPDRGGVFREGVAGAPQYLHPVWCRNDLGADSDLCNLVYRGLMQLDANGRIVPDLAESWSTIDGRVYQFRLRPNLFWHDGQALTVDDVYFSLTTLQDPALANIPGLSTLWRSMTVEKLDERTIQVTLPQPFAPFIDLMTVGLLPEHIYRNTPVLDLVTKPLTANPIGAGPMRIVEIASNRARLEPSPFNGGQTPYILALELRFYPDYPSIVAAFDEQQIDGLSTILPGDIRIAAQRDDIQLFSSVESAYENVLLNLNNPNTPFFQDRRVREALLAAIDRTTLIDDVLSGQGVVAHGTIAPGHWAYSDAVAQHPYDPDRARALLEQAGWVDGNGDGVREQDGAPLRFILLVKDDLRHQQIGAYLAESWAEIGVSVNVQPVSFNGMVSDFLAPRAFEAALTDWRQVGDPDPFAQWHSSQIEGNGQNYGAWNNPNADQLMEAARATTDEAQRREYYAEFQAIFADELPALPLFHPLYTYGVSTRVNNVQIGALNTPSERFSSFPSWYIDSRRIPASQVQADATSPSPADAPGAP